MQTVVDKKNTKLTDSETLCAQPQRSTEADIRKSILDEVLNCEANIESSQDIPVIDAKPILQYAQDHQVTTTWLDTVKQLENALKEVGFLSLTNHGLNANAAKSISQTFFQQPLSEKMKHAQRPDFHFGYTGSGTERLFLSEDEYDAQPTTQTEGDPKESLNIPPLHLDWRWPASSPGFDAEKFRGTMTDYFKDCERFAHAFLQSLAHVLGETDDFFTDKMQEHMSVVRTLNYPATETLQNVEEAGMRASSHTDFGLLTLLQTFGTPGLQVQNKSGNWINVVLQDPNHLVVNIGDALSRMTNGVFKSTRHRVAQFIPGQRQSIPYFVNFNEQALIEPVRKYRKASGNYPPVASGTYIYYKNGLAMGFEQRSVAHTVDE